MGPSWSQAWNPPHHAEQYLGFEFVLVPRGPSLIQQSSGAELAAWGTGVQDGKWIAQVFLAFFHPNILGVLGNREFGAEGVEERRRFIQEKIK